MVWEEMLSEEFQDGHHGGHLRYGNGQILAILNFCITVMPFPLSFGSIRLTVWEEMSFKEFRSTQSDLWFGRRCHLKNFRMAILDIGT